MIIRGIVPPAITPVNDHGEIDTGAVAQLVDRMAAAGATGVFILGSSGEGPTVTEHQRRAAITAFVDAADRRLGIYAGVIEAGALRGKDAARVAEELGADAIVVSAPSYYAGMDQAQVADHLASVASSVSVPAVAYNIPSHTQNPITPSMVGQLADSGYIALKDSSADWEVFAALSEACHRCGLSILQGAESLLARSVLAGADGAVPGIANLVPELAVSTFEAASAGKAVEALELQRRLDEACTIYEAGYWLPSLKHAAGVALGATSLVDGTAGLTSEAIAELSRRLALESWTRSDR